MSPNGWPCWLHSEMVTCSRPSSPPAGLSTSCAAYLLGASIRHYSILLLLIIKYKRTLVVGDGECLVCVDAIEQALQIEKHAAQEIVLWGVPERVLWEPLVPIPLEIVLFVPNMGASVE